MKKNYLLMLLCVLLCSTGLMAQTVIKGKVLSRADNQPIPGATVAPNGETGQGVAADADGNFTINLKKPQGILTIRSIGYTTVEHPYNGSATITIQMEEESKLLSEVILVGYGKNSRSNISSSVENVSMDKVTNRSIKSANEFLQGQIAGVTVLSNGGDPTAAPKITIRGIGTLNGESPLWVVDGVPYDGPPINPEDIETMSVVKDASAAIYGSRAAAGVILVSTKSGKQGRMTIGVNSSFGVKKAHNLLYSLDAAELADVRNLAADNAGVSRDDAFNENVNPNARITKTNWVDEIFRPGSFEKHDLSLSFGNEKASLYTSFGYLKEKGILLNTNFDRYNYRLNASYSFFDRLKVGTRINVNYSDGNKANTTSAYSGAIFTALSYPPNASVYDEKDPSKFGGIPADYAGSYGDLVNPVAELLRNDIHNPLLDALVSGNVDFKIVDHLSYKFNISANIASRNYKNFEPKVLEIGKINTLNSLEQSNNLYRQTLSEHILEYDNRFGAHQLNALVGYTQQKNRNEYFVVRGENFDNEDPGTRHLENAKQINKDGTNGTAWEEVLISYLAKVSYNYDNRYLLNAIVRRDGSSKLYGEKFDIFPSLSAGWNIANEDFFNKNGIVSRLKLRASWGRLGNLSSLQNYYPGYALLSPKSALFGQTPELDAGFVLNNIANTTLKWEISEQTDIGLDASLFDNKLNLIADYYIKNTSDMIMPQDIVATAGVGTPPFVNAGGVKNTGFEFSANHKGGGALKYSVWANFSINHNNVEKLYSKDYIENDANVRSTLYPIRSQVGHGLFAFYGQKVEGIFQSVEEVNAHKAPNGNLLQPDAVPGDFKFANLNGDNVINADDRTFLGSPFPKYTYSLNTDLEYKNFDLSIFFQGVQDVQAVNGLKLTGLTASIQGYNMLKDIQNAWSPENTSSSIPIISSSDNNKNFTTFSDFYVEDASYLRMKNITLGYTFSPNMFNKVFSKLRVFGSVDNVFTLTKYTGFDPEVGADRFGIDIGRYPQARTFMLGLNAQF